MKRLLDRAYARQRLASFDQSRAKQRDEAIRGAGWTVFFLIVIGAFLLSGWLG